MKAEWRRFLLQWILPVGVFGVVLVIMFAGFTANIKQETANTYQESLAGEAKTYAARINAAIQRAEVVGSVAANLFAEYEMKDEVKTNIMSSAIANSDAYLMVYCDADGKGICNTGEKIELGQMQYFRDISTSGVYKYRFIADDGLGNGSAMVIKMAVGDSTDSLLVFFPMNTNTVRKNVPVGNDFDSTSFAMVTDMDGLISASSYENASLGSNENMWDVLTASGNNANNLRRIKTKIQAQASGGFSATLDKADYYFAYTPISGTGQCLIVAYQVPVMEKYVAKQYESILGRLSWIVVVFVLFVVVITVLNIIEIYVESRNTEDLKDKADTDQLTGLKNKLATEREIKEYIDNNPDALGMMFLIDIDNFKKINDTMGHAFGDEVLRELGRHIGINFRVSDIIGRTGGDEFMVFLKNLKEEQNCLREAQKLIYFFRHFQVGDYVKYSVTASIGAAVFPAHGTDFETLYKAADAAVYKSKKRGKNQLSFYDDRDRTPEEVAYADAHQIDIERKEETPIES